MIFQYYFYNISELGELHIFRIQSQPLGNINKIEFNSILSLLFNMVFFYKCSKIQSQILRRKFLGWMVTDMDMVKISKKYCWFKNCSGTFLKIFQYYFLYYIRTG